MSPVVALVDLDDTLFQARRKCPPEIADKDLTALGFARDGSPLGFATPHQMRFLAWLAETAHLIPVTARSRDALARVNIRHFGAVCAHGGVILDDRGTVDAGWAGQIEEQALRHGSALEAVALAIAASAACKKTAVSARVLSEGSTPLYVLAKHDDADAGALRTVVEAMRSRVSSGWTVHLNDNNAAILPPYLGKHHAVAHLMPDLRKRFPGVPVIGIGDSLTDAPFMALCDFAMLPTASQLAAGVFDVA